MKLCNETITVFNRTWNAETGREVYVPTIIKGVSWFSELVSAVDATGLHAADRFIIRIPQDADFSGKQYVEPNAFQEKASDTYKILGPDSKPLLSEDGDFIVYYIHDDEFTLKSGDVIVKAAVEESISPAQLQKRFVECCTILGVTDNRRAPNAPHFKVVGA